MLQMAADMDQNAHPNALQEQVVYFDGTHSRCVGFKTLGLFFFPPRYEATFKDSINGSKV